MCHSVHLWTLPNTSTRKSDVSCAVSAEGWGTYYVKLVDSWGLLAGWFLETYWSLAYGVQTLFMVPLYREEIRPLQLRSFAQPLISNCKELPQKDQQRLRKDCCTFCSCWQCDIKEIEKKTLCPVKGHIPIFPLCHCRFISPDWRHKSSWTKFNLWLKPPSKAVTFLL